MNPAALGIITSTFPDPARRARAIGVWDAAYGLSMVAGPVAGGILVAMAGWRAVFWASIPAGLAALALTGLVAPDSRAPRPRRADPAGQVLLIVMLAALTTAIIQAPGWGWAAPQTAALVALAAAALAALAYCEPRRADPLIQFGLFRSAAVHRGHRDRRLRDRRARQFRVPVDLVPARRPGHVRAARRPHHLPDGRRDGRLRTAGRAPHRPQRHPAPRHHRRNRPDGQQRRAYHG